MSKKIKLPENPPHKYAIFVWRTKLGRHGLTLPMLAAFSLWYKGGNFEDIEEVRKEAMLIGDEMYEHPDCAFPVCRRNEKRGKIGPGFDVVGVDPVPTRIHHFTCGRIGELVFALNTGGIPIQRRLAMPRYPWTGVSKNNDAWGPLTAWDLTFFRCVKHFMEKGSM